MENTKEVTKLRWAIQRGNAKQVVQEVNGVEKYFNRYVFDLSIPFIIPIKNSDDKEVCIGLLVYLCAMTYDCFVGFILEDGNVHPERVENIKFMSHEKSLFEDIKQHVNVDRIETGLFSV